MQHSAHKLLARGRVTAICKLFYSLAESILGFKSSLFDGRRLFHKGIVQSITDVAGMKNDLMSVRPTLIDRSHLAHVLVHMLRMSVCLRPKDHVLAFEGRNGVIADTRMVEARI